MATKSVSYIVQCNSADVHMVWNIIDAQRLWRINLRDGPKRHHFRGVLHATCNNHDA